MEFKKYPSIENSYQIKTVENIIFHEKSKQDWIVHEKIHGANFALYFNVKEVKAARRNSFLEKGDCFYGYQKIVDKYGEKLKEIFEIFDTKDASYWILYGELYGGGKHPTQECNLPIEKKIQKEVWYRPDHSFCAFDLCFVNKDNTVEFASWDMFEMFCTAAKIEYPPILFKGSFEDALQQDNKFYPYNPLNMEHIENNVCEGVVIRPKEHFELPNCKRAILKNKNDKFKEVVIHKEKTIEIPDGFVHFSNLANNFITENRLNNVLSKIGEINSIKQLGEVIKSYNNDWQEEFIETYEELKEYTRNDLKTIFQNAQKKAINLIKEWFAKNV